MMRRLKVLFLVCVLVYRCYGDSQHCSKGSNVNDQGCQANKYAEDKNVGWFGGIINDIYNSGENIVRKLVGAPPKSASEPEMPQPEVRKYDFANEPMPTLEELKLQARQMATSFMKEMGGKLDDVTLEKLFGVEVLNKEDVQDIPDGETLYEYPALFRHAPTKVDDVMDYEIDGKEYTLIARSVNPPIFEVPGFLTDEECDLIVAKSEEKELNESRLFVGKVESESSRDTGRERRSYSTYLLPHKDDIDQSFMDKLYQRISKLLKLPVNVIRWSEPLAIGRYTSGGFYHVHLDSIDPLNNYPCCFQTTCENKHGERFAMNSDCCRICRYATVLYYLSDVEEGGETAFPLADTSFTEMLEYDKIEGWQNVTEHCHDSSVLIKPKKGTAIFWYNHALDKNGYIAAVDKRSYHGGWNVIKGTKWIATNWINTPKYNKRYIPSKYKKLYEEGITVE